MNVFGLPKYFGNDTTSLSLSTSPQKPWYIVKIFNYLLDTLEP